METSYQIADFGLRIADLKARPTPSFNPQSAIRNPK